MGSTAIIVGPVKVLLSAYDCDPVRGSEARLSWNYVVELSRLGHRLHVLTSNRSFNDLPPALAAHNDTIDHPVEVSYVDDHPLARRLPGIGFMGRYLLWQRTALDVARDVDARFDADVVHHVGWGSMQGGSRLWRLGKPFVFGPVGGGQFAPAEFRRYFGDAWRSEWLRTLVSVRSMRLLPPARGSVVNAAVVLVANPETADAARRLGARRVEPFSDIAIPEELVAAEIRERRDDEPLRVIWLARNLARKALPLALEAMAAVDPGCPVTFTVIGADGSEPELADRMEGQIDERVEFRGQVDFESAQAALAESDVFLFTSLRDTTGVQLLEALAKGLAVITLDHQGGGRLITDDIGIKVPVLDPERTTASVARAIEALAADRPRLRAMQEAALDRARTMLWSDQGRAVDDVYRSLF